eukprot:gnl/TRDRNA2_/TRDRNA2_31043_c0_seq1.p1 gnl/TRDRNA2_/TRDRNA2_31043_c0~~gnl/TRDRNA2_/TRDRNA2_31043_c0_seq1.p1  ORF type:complete len:748 (+),score=137.60 gnl/TRDRNA2_/TRDRNA2_31043_c0_seq1:95-2245(+)
MDHDLDGFPMACLDRHEAATNVQADAARDPCEARHLQLLQSIECLNKASQHHTAVHNALQEAVRQREAEAAARDLEADAKHRTLQESIADLHGRLAHSQHCSGSVLERLEQLELAVHSSGEGRTYSSPRQLDTATALDAREIEIEERMERFEREITKQMQAHWTEGQAAHAGDHCMVLQQLASLEQKVRAIDVELVRFYTSVKEHEAEVELKYWKLQERVGELDNSNGLDHPACRALMERLAQLDQLQEATKRQVSELLERQQDSRVRRGDCSFNEEPSFATPQSMVVTAVKSPPKAVDDRKLCRATPMARAQEAARLEGDAAAASVTADILSRWKMVYNIGPDHQALECEDHATSSPPTKAPVLASVGTASATATGTSLQSLSSSELESLEARLFKEVKAVQERFLESIANFVNTESDSIASLGGEVRRLWEAMNTHTHDGSNKHGGAVMSQEKMQPRAAVAYGHRSCTPPEHRTPPAPEPAHNVLAPLMAPTRVSVRVLSPAAELRRVTTVKAAPRPLSPHSPRLIRRSPSPDPSELRRSVTTVPVHQVQVERHVVATARTPPVPSPPSSTLTRTPPVPFAHSQEHGPSTGALAVMSQYLPQHRMPSVPTHQPPRPLTPPAPPSLLQETPAALSVNPHTASRAAASSAPTSPNAPPPVGSAYSGPTTPVHLGGAADDSGISSRTGAPGRSAQLHERRRSPERRLVLGGDAKTYP